MTLGEMVTQVRVDVGDENSTRWTTDVPIRKALNNAAQFVSRQIERYSRRVLYNRGTATFTTASNTLAYALSGATDFQRVWRMFRTDVEQDAVEISEPDKYTGGAVDDRGRWVFYMTRNASTGVFSVNFPWEVPAGMDFTVVYLARTANLATDGTGDSSSYTTIDADFHELVCLRAATRLLGPDGVNAAPIAALYQEAMSDMISAMSRTSSPSSVLDETAWVY